MISGAKMTVKELIELLKDMPQDSTIYISRDQEGNGFHALNNCDTGKIQEQDWCLDSYYSDQHSDGDCCLGPSERDKMIPIVVLWP